MRILPVFSDGKDFTPQVLNIIHKEDIIPQILDIHEAFASAWEQIQKFYRLEIDPLYCESSSGTFIAELDRNSHVVLLNFVIKGNVLRHGSVTVDLIFFSPIVNQNTGEIISEGIKMEELLEMQWGNVIFSFRLHNSLKDSVVLYRLFKRKIDFSKNHILDDLGEVWVKKDAIDALRVSSIPSKYLIEYELVGTSYHAKYTKTTELDCVLFAETDNPHDLCAIKVLRWFPEVRVDNQISLKGHLFFHLGYIRRTQNSELHNYMVENSCRILFAKCHNSKINIKGGIKCLGEENLYYPSCLINIPVYE